MSAVAHYLEDEGLSTTLVALVRVHAQKIAPPRALWVPFILGRPLGTPGDAALQRRVLLGALGLLVSDAGSPLLVDFNEEAPDAQPDPGWQPPLELSAGSIEQEVSVVRPLYERALARTGRTTVGLTGVHLEELAQYVEDYSNEVEPLVKPRRGMSDATLMRFAADDLKAFYLEAVAEGEGRPSAWQMSDWFWNQTRIARALQTIRAKAPGSSNKQRQVIGARSVVPERYRD